MDQTQAAPVSFFQWMSEWIEANQNVLVRTKQDGKMAHVPLNQVQNQRLVVQVFQSGLREYVESLPKQDVGKKAGTPAEVAV